MKLNPVTQPSVASARVLVIEDDVDTATLLWIVLEEAGYDVTLAPNAHDALRVLGPGRPEATRVAFDLVLLDLGLPDADGVDLVRRLRKQGVSLPPVIIVSARFSRSVDAAAAQIGARDVVYKPFDLRDLLDCVRDALAQQKR